MTDDEKLVWAAAFGAAMASGESHPYAAQVAARTVRVLRSSDERAVIEDRLGRGTEAMQMFDDMRRM